MSCFGWSGVRSAGIHGRRGRCDNDTTLRPPRSGLARGGFAYQAEERHGRFAATGPWRSLQLNHRSLCRTAAVYACPIYRQRASITSGGACRRSTTPIGLLTTTTCLYYRTLALRMYESTCIFQHELAPQHVPVTLRRVEHLAWDTTTATTRMHHFAAPAARLSARGGVSMFAATDCPPLAPEVAPPAVSPSISAPRRGTQWTGLFRRRAPSRGCCWCCRTTPHRRPSSLPVADAGSTSLAAVVLLGVAGGSGLGARHAPAGQAGASEWVELRSNAGDSIAPLHRDRSSRARPPSPRVARASYLAGRTVEAARARGDLARPMSALLSSRKSTRRRTLISATCGTAPLVAEGWSFNGDATVQDQREPRRQSVDWPRA